MIWVSKWDGMELRWNDMVDGVVVIFGTALMGKYLW
jgi:hypothetical protein